MVDGFSSTMKKKIVYISIILACFYLGTEFVIFKARNTAKNFIIRQIELLKNNSNVSIANIDVPNINTVKLGNITFPIEKIPGLIAIDDIAINLNTSEIYNYITGKNTAISILSNLYGGTGNIDIVGDRKTGLKSLKLNIKNINLQKHPLIASLGFTNLIGSVLCDKILNDSNNITGECPISISDGEKPEKSSIPRIISGLSFDIPLPSVSGLQGKGLITFNQKNASISNILITSSLGRIRGNLIATILENNKVSLTDGDISLQLSLSGQQDIGGILQFVCAGEAIESKNYVIAIKNGFPVCKKL